MTTNLGTPTITVKGPFWSAEVDLVGVTTPLALGPGELLIERFSQYNANEDPLNWVDTERHNSFDEDQSLFKTFLQGNQIVFGTHSSDINIHSHYVAPGVLSWTNYVYTGRIFITDSQGGVGVTFFNRYAEDEDSYYRLRTTRSKQTFHIAPHPHGERTVDQENFDSGIAPQANTWYRFYIEIEDASDRTNIRAKIWVDGTPEPDGFQMDTFDDSDDRLRSGAVGVWAAHAGQKYYDDLRVRTLNGADLALPQLGAVVLDERFDQLEIDQDPAHWQDTGANNSFTVDETLFKTALIDEEKVFGTASELPNVHSHYVVPGALNWTNYAFSGRMYVDGPSVGVTFFSRFPAAENSYYRLRAYGGHPTFHIAPHPHGERTVDQKPFDSGIRPEPNTWYRFYIEVEDAEADDRTNIRAKVWQDNTLEPPNFQIDTFDQSSDRLRAGTIGLWSHDDSKSYFDDLLVQPLLRRNAALRTLFVNRQPSRALGGQQVLLPGTLIALVSPRSVTIEPEGPSGATYRWQREAAPAFDTLSIETIKAFLADGQLSLLLIEVDHTQWPQTPNPLPTFTCINGEINLDQLQDQNDSSNALYSALTLNITAELGRRPGATELLGRTTVHSSGATLFGGIHLPWMDAGEQVNAPFLLARLISRDTNGNSRAQYRLKAEVERLSPTEQERWIQAWRDLSRYLNPRNPLNGVGFEARPAPIWTTLEITDPLNVPNLFWHIQQWADIPQIRFAPGEINLLLSDRQPYSQEQPPTTLATIAPMAEIPLTVTDQGDTLQIELIVGNRGDATQPKTVHYEATPQDNSETIEFPDFELAFDAVETPRLLRDSLGFPAPEEIDGASNSLKAAPILWGFVPLDDGWAQLPVPNMTERLYFEAQAKSTHRDSPDRLANGDRVDAMQTEEDANQPSILQGAVGLGNSYPDSLTEHPNEQPWSLTLTRLQYVKGTWTLAKSNDGFELTHVTLRLEEPEIIANGFFWLSRSRPTAGDAIPDLANWVNGLQQIPLRSIGKFPASQPPIARLDFNAVTLSLRDSDTAPSAHLNQWSLHYRIHQQTLETLANVKQLINDTLENTPPLVWRRHPTLPTIQALPMTQTLSPPNFPSASRQLAPYQLALDQLAWKLGVPAEEGRAASAAAQWPEILSDSIPAAEWQRHGDLPMAALTLPGLNFDPDTTRLASGLSDAVQNLLPVRYRFDLPYTDQLNALSQVPKEPRDPDTVSPLPDSTPPQLVKPLERATLEAHWKRLSELASLASVAAADAMIQTATGQATIQRLIEPLKWLVSVDLDLTTYPGTIKLNNAEAPLATPLQLYAESALEGISGHFVETPDATDTMVLTNNPDADGYAVRAGSMQSRVVDDGLRDQRGLLRKLTQYQDGDQNLIFTEVTLNGDETVSNSLGTSPGESRNRTYHLMSLTEAVSLKTSGQDTWTFWLKDLPAEVGAEGSSTTRIFARNTILSPILRALEPHSQGASIAAINDPEALSREQNYRMGYEWRLGAGDQLGFAGDVQPLNLNGLVFFPLTLERVEFSETGIEQIEIVGRLQLPLAPSDTIESELTDLSNAVRLIYTTMQTTTRSLALTEVRLESPVIEWPLQLVNGEQTNAPRIEWRQVRLGENQEIIVGNRDADTAGAAKCRFVLFGQEWCISLGELSFDAGAPQADGSLLFSEVNGDTIFEQAAQNRSVVPYKFDIALNRMTGVHETTLRVLVRTGEVAQPALEAIIQFVLVPPLLPTPSVILDSATLFGQLSIETTDQPIQYVPEAIQFVWESCAPASAEDSASTSQFLPGMILNRSNCPGFLALTFEARVENASPDSQTQIPTLNLTSAFSETLIETRWGTFSQTQPGEITPADQLLAQRFGSSAGEIFIGYTAQWRVSDTNADLDGGTWEQAFLLNGFLEVKNLISWPAKIQMDEENGLLTLPALAPDSTLDHLHHTVRILLNQQIIPSGILARILTPDPSDPGREGTPTPYIFTLDDNHSWQFLAVVEHQLLETRLLEPSSVSNSDMADSVPQPLALETLSERRWTTLQEIRLLRPQAYAEFLAADATQVFDPVNGIAPRWSLYGHFHSAWATRLTNPDSSDSLHGLGADMLLVEASAPHWIRAQSVEALLAAQLDQDDNTEPAEMPTLSGTTLQFLPSGSQSGILSNVQDYGPSAPSMPEWQLLTMPFLGRLQDAAQDGLVPSIGEQEPVATAKQSHPLRVDPILQLWRHTQDKIADLPPLVYMLTSWGVEADVRLRFSEFEHAASRLWARLDPLSLEENWFRLQHPPTEPPVTGVSSVMAALPDTPARLSRATALRNAFDAFRSYYPPQLVVAAGIPMPALETDVEQTPIWREESLLLWQAGVQNHAGSIVAYPWLPIGLQIYTSSILHQPRSISLPHHAAATLIPARLTVDGQANPTPVSFAVSPYLGLARHLAPEKPELFLASLELLGLDTSTNQLRPIASLLREESDQKTLEQLAVEWGYETRLRERPSSPLGIVRRRQLLKTSTLENGTSQPAAASDTESSLTSALLIATYGFSLVRQSQTEALLTKQVVALRSDIRELRFREGQYGGSIMPKELMPYEVAPPTINGVQPIYIVPPALQTEASTAENGLPREVSEPISPNDEDPRSIPAWRWGISGLTVGVQYTGGQLGAENGTSKVGITGRSPLTPELSVTLWWHAPQHQVQFRSAISDMGLTGGLPPLFRAKAINSLLPTLSHLAFPTAKSLQESAGKKEDQSPTDSLIHWQPVLPGSLNYLLVGARAGAMLAIRNQLLRQHGLLFTEGESGNGGTAPEIDTLVSGSVPVQHRVPRPAPLPPNDETKQQDALQTWASYFRSTQTVGVDSGPMDEAFFAACGDHVVLTRRSFNRLESTSVPPLTAAAITALSGVVNQPFDTAIQFFNEVTVDDNLKPLVSRAIAPMAQGLLMRLDTPTMGMTASNWNGELTFQLAFEDKFGDRDDWEISIRLVEGAQRVQYTEKVNAASQNQLVFETKPKDTNDPNSEDDRQKLANILGNKQPGETLTIQADIKPKASMTDFRQTLIFPLRIIDDRQLRLPLEPRFTLFEDPEYNRRLASLSGRVAKAVLIDKPVGMETELLLQTVTLSTDRREYNPSSIVALRYDWDDPDLQQSSKASISFKRVDKQNTPFSLENPPDLELDNPADRFANLETGDTHLLRFNLADFKPVNTEHPNAFRPGETLQIILKLEPGATRVQGLTSTQKVILTVNIIAEPVTPPPDAAYGLLRYQNIGGRTEVECARFAWGPEASRVDLVCPADLLQEVVRRRAVFKWLDSVRPAAEDAQDAQYQVQKIAENGATHFPMFGEDKPVNEI